MNVSPVNGTQNRTNYSFENYEEIKDVTGKLNEEVTKSNSIKKPVQVVASIALAGLTAYAGGKQIAKLTTKIAPKLPETMEKGLNSVSKAAKKGADKLQTEAPGKLGKFKNTTSKVILKAQNIGSKAYNKIANIGIKEGATAAEKANNAFSNIVAAGTTTAVLTSVLGKDKNSDGVKDIMQTDQNVYAAANEKVTDAMGKASIFAELVSALT